MRDGNPQRGTIVEFLGLPGSGKSTLAREVAARLADRGVSVFLPTVENIAMSSFDYRGRLRLLASRLVRKPITSLWIAVSVILTAQRSVADLRTVWENLMRLSEMLEHSRCTPGTHLVDQGLLQGILSTSFAARRFRAPSTMAALATSFPPSDLVVVVRVEPSMARARLLQRPRKTSRVQAHLLNDPGVLFRMQSDLEEIIAAFQTRQRGEGRLLNVDTSLPHERGSAVNRVLAAVEQLGTRVGRGRPPKPKWRGLTDWGWG